MQLIAQINQIFQSKKGLKLWLRPYEILATGQRCGLIEVVQDALSIDSIKRKMGGQQTQATLLDFFQSQFGPDMKSKSKYFKDNLNFQNIKRLRTTSADHLQHTLWFATFYKSKTGTMEISLSISRVTSFTLTSVSSFPMHQVKVSSWNRLHSN